MYNYTRHVYYYTCVCGKTEMTNSRLKKLCFDCKRKQIANRHYLKKYGKTKIQHKLDKIKCRQDIQKERDKIRLKEKRNAIIITTRNI